MTSRFEELFAGFQRSAWRLEVRDVYYQPGDEDRLAEFRRTGRAPIKTRENSGWIRTIESARARRAYIGRVRLLGHPMTEYTRFELSAYTFNADAGEDIRILDRARLDESWDRAPDVWVFDDQVAIKMRYADDGSWQGIDDVNAAPFVAVRRAIEPYAVPLVDYRQRELPSSRTESPVPVSLPALAAA